MMQVGRYRYVIHTGLTIEVNKVVSHCQIPCLKDENKLVQQLFGDLIYCLAEK